MEGAGETQDTAPKQGVSTGQRHQLGLLWWPCVGFQKDQTVSTGSRDPAVPSLSPWEIMCSRSQQASTPLWELFWGCFSPSVCSSTAAMSPYILEADCSHPCSPLPVPTSRQLRVQESLYPYPVTEMEGSQQQESPCCGPV